MKQRRRGSIAGDRARREHGRRPLILVVEDNPDQREIYSSYLRFQGFRVLIAGDGETGVQAAREMQPDLIVMDLSLPRLDGWEATRRLKAHSATAHIPVLACTAHAFGSAVERALVAGCDSYLVKPCLPEDLTNEIRRLLADFARRPAQQA